MKNKIFAKLKREYSPLGLGDEVLMSRAESLAAMGLVTDENIDAVVAVQKADLEAIQARADKRVNDALEKERKKFEEEKLATEAKTKEEQEKKAKEEADKKAAEEAERKKAEEAERKKTEEATEEARLKEELKKLKEQGVSKEILDYLKSVQERAEAERKAVHEANALKQAEFEAQFASILSASKSKHEEYLKSFEELTKQHTALKTDYDTLKAENEAAKLAKATADRQNFILSKARELGIPTWRVEEGFNIATDATEDVIVEALTKTANNIRTAKLPSSEKVAFSASDEKPSAEDIAALAKSIVK